MDEVQGEADPHAPPPMKRDRKQHQLRNFRLRLILPFAVPALLLAPLACLKISPEVETVLQVSQMSFKVGEPRSTGIFNAVQTRSLSLLNFQTVDLGSGVLEMATVSEPSASVSNNWQQIDTGARTRIRATDRFASVTLDDVTLNQLNVKPGAVLTLVVPEREPHSLQLRVNGAEIDGHVAAGKTLRLSCRYCAVSDSSGRDGIDSKRLLRFRSEREHVITFVGRMDGTTIALDLLPGTKLIEQGIDVAGDMDFTQMEGSSRNSTIIGNGGTVTSEQLAKEVKVKAGDFVILDKVKNFFIERLHIADGITVMLHGQVGKLATGPKQYVKDRRPSILEWLYSRKALALYLQAVVLIGTTALALLTRLKIVREEN